ncbi:PIN domain-containing protein [Achromobacter xylosoxidans]
MKQVTRKANLHVVFDTNVIWSDSILDLFSNVTVSLIRQHSGHQDVAINWVLPRVARQEREYQMRRKALSHLPAVQKLESLVGFNWGVDEAKIADALCKRIDDELKSLGVREMKIDPSATDWDSIMSDSANRIAPFEHKDNGEKGFRDALICESLRQMLSAANRSDQVFFVSNDTILQAAALKIMALVGHPKSRCVQTLDDLRTEINVLVSKIPDEFAQRLVELGAKFFINEQSNEGLFYAENIRSLIEKEFATVIDSLMAELESPTETISISKPVFRQKVRQRVHFTTSVTLTFEENRTDKSKDSIEDYQAEANSRLLDLLSQNPEKFKAELRLYNDAKALLHRTRSNRAPLITWKSLWPERRKASFDVEWSVSVNNKQQLSRAKVDRIMAASDT